MFDDDTRKECELQMSTARSRFPLHSLSVSTVGKNRILKDEGFWRWWAATQKGSHRYYYHSNAAALR